NPSVIAIDGQEAKITLKQDVLYMKGTDDDGHPEWDTVEVGPELTFTPKIEENGYINRNANKPRTIEVVSERTSPERADERLAKVSLDIDNNLISLPVIGRVAAGMPVLAEQNVEENLSLPTSIVGDYSSFILRVKGDSMINAGIFDGDYIVVKEQSDAHNGEIVVALVDDSATVKTFYRERYRVRLQPENDSMEPIYVKNPVILGRVTALIRSIS
ncbi:MAG: transcriptional repressor LexA, partial [Atopobiaceae bacterium]|nr:transcriptional repressor LexA [Atopobiaceae bacterium]